MSAKSSTACRPRSTQPRSSLASKFCSVPLLGLSRSCNDAGACNHTQGHRRHEAQDPLRGEARQRTGRDILVAAGARHVPQAQRAPNASRCPDCQQQGRIVAIGWRSPVAALRFDVEGWCCLRPRASRVTAGSRKARYSGCGSGTGPAPSAARERCANRCPCGSGRGAGIADGNGLAQSPAHAHFYGCSPSASISAVASELDRGAS